MLVTQANSVSRTWQLQQLLAALPGCLLSGRTHCNQWIAQFPPPSLCGLPASEYGNNVKLGLSTTVHLHLRCVYGSFSSCQRRGQSRVESTHMNRRGSRLLPCLATDQSAYAQTHTNLSIFPPNLEHWQSARKKEFNNFETFQRSCRIVNTVLSRRRALFP